MKIYFYTQATDMRKSIDTLCMAVVEVLKMNPSEGHLFLFRNRKGDKLKALYYETNAYTIWYRRLERGKFIFPKNAAGNIELEPSHFEWLLASGKYSRMEALLAEKPSYFI